VSWGCGVVGQFALGGGGGYEPKKCDNYVVGRGDGKPRPNWVGFSDLPGSLSSCRFAGDIGGTGHIFTTDLPTDYWGG
jgi:hypothetical protein